MNVVFRIFIFSPIHNNSIDGFMIIYRLLYILRIVVQSRRYIRLHHQAYRYPLPIQSVEDDV